VARAVRIEYGGAFYHLMARRNRRERIFRDEAKLATRSAANNAQTAVH
jgi:hypothetical protein